MFCFNNLILLEIRKNLSVKQKQNMEKKNHQFFKGFFTQNRIYFFVKDIIYRKTVFYAKWYAIFRRIVNNYFSMLGSRGKLFKQKVY